MSIPLLIFPSLTPPTIHPHLRYRLFFILYIYVLWIECPTLARFYVAMLDILLFAIIILSTAQVAVDPMKRNKATLHLSQPTLTLSTPHYIIGEQHIMEPHPGYFLSIHP